MFSGYPTYNPYRVLALSPGQPLLGEPSGAEDVYALQCGINAIVNITPIATDGILGRQTSNAIVRVQRQLGFTGDEIDGKAGQVTQRAIAVRLGRMFVQGQVVPLWLVKGQLAFESSYLLGNYSRPMRPDGTYDAGVAQLNVAYHRPVDAFNPVHAIGFLVSETRQAHLAYQDTRRFIGSDQSEARRWKLAAGHHNAPAYTNYLAGLPESKKYPWAIPGPEARTKIEEYMTAVTVYMP